MEFNNKQLTFAREYRGYSQTDLASKVPGLSQSNLSKFEKGLSTLSDDLKMKIVDFLNFPTAFYCQKISNTIENPHYRKRSTLNKTQVAEIDRSIKLIGYIIDQMAESIEWPEFSLTPLDVEDYSPEKSAKHTRKLLGLTIDEPVTNICTLLEKKGIIIVFIDFPEKFDGVSILTDNGYPVMIINKKYSNDRKRFTIAHELGHMIMHVIGGFPIPDSRENCKESEADRFASEFLMPAEAIEDSLRGLKLSYLQSLKSYWLTSMASIVRRARDLKCINQEWYTYLNIEMSRMGLKKDEKSPVFIDEPKLFELGYKMHKNDLDYSDKEMAEAFKIPLDVLERFVGSSGATKLRVLI